MSKLIASLIVSTIAACAGRTQPPVAPPTTPSPSTCAPSGPVLFEIDTNDLTAGPQKQIIYASGAWQLDAAGGGTTTGCLTANDLATIQRDVSSPWESTDRGGIQCHMVHAPTNYIVNGKIVYVDSGCPSGVLDDTTRKALTEIEQIMTTAATKHASY